MTNSGISHDVAIVIPIYKMNLNTAERFSIENTIKVLSRHNIFFIAPKKLAAWMERYVTGLNKAGIQAIYFDNRYFSSINSYNKLLLSSAFYRVFSNYRFMLIVQPDALVFSDMLNDWMEKDYSYIGAPWFYGMEQPERPLKFLGVGNGGLSLRRIDDFIRVLSQPRYIPNSFAIKAGSKRKALGRFIRYIYHRYFFAYNIAPLLPRVNEDIFWGILVPDKFKFFLVPTPVEAIRFAFDAEPAFLYELTDHQLPFGCHAWEKYDLGFWKEVLLAENMVLP